MKAISIAVVAFAGVAVSADVEHHKLRPTLKDTLTLDDNELFLPQIQQNLQQAGHHLHQQAAGLTKGLQQAGHQLNKHASMFVAETRHNLEQTAEFLKNNPEVIIEGMKTVQSIARATGNGLEMGSQIAGAISHDDDDELYSENLEDNELFLPPQIQQIQQHLQQAGHQLNKHASMFVAETKHNLEQTAEFLKNNPEIITEGVKTAQSIAHATVKGVEMGVKIAGAVAKIAAAAHDDELYSENLEDNELFLPPQIQQIQQHLQQAGHHLHHQATGLTKGLQQAGHQLNKHASMFVAETRHNLEQTAEFLKNNPEIIIEGMKTVQSIADATGKGLEMGSKIAGAVSHDDDELYSENLEDNELFLPPQIQQIQQHLQQAGHHLHHQATGLTKGLQQAGHQLNKHASMFVAETRHNVEQAAEFLKNNPEVIIEGMRTVQSIADATGKGLEMGSKIAGAVSHDDEFYSNDAIVELADLLSKTSK